MATFFRKKPKNLPVWKDHFENILNRPEPEQVVEIPPAAEDLDICIDPPTMEEVKAAIKGMWSRWSDSRNAQG